MTASGHGAEEGFLREDGELEPDAISANRRNLGVPDSISGNERNLIRNGRNLLLIPNAISGNERNLVGGRVEGEFFDALPEATDDSEDALRHGGCDVENGVQVVRHEAVLEQFDLGVALGDLGEVEVPQGSCGRCRCRAKRCRIVANAKCRLPCAPNFAQSYKKNLRYASFRGKFF